MRKIAVLMLVLVFLTALCLLELFPAKAASAMIVVPDDYPTIHAAVGNATDGVIIFIKKGTYEEPLNKTLIINKSIALIGENASDTKIILHPPLIPYIMFPDTRLMVHESAIKIETSQASIASLTITTDGNGIYVSGDAVVLDGNRLNMGVSVEADGVQLISNTMTFITVSGDNNTVVNNNVANPSEGNGFISCEGSYNLIANNTIRGRTGSGSEVYGRFNVFYGNTIEKGSVGINGDDNIIGKNHITGSEGAGMNIYFYNGSNNIVFANRIIRGAGLGVGMGYNNSFFANEIVSNSVGFTFGDSKATILYHNNFIGNTYQVWTGQGAHGTVSFDNGYEGNYWSDYSGLDANGDGIGDTPYAVDDERQDRHPLMAPFDIDSVVVEMPEWANTSDSVGPFPTTIVIASVITAAVYGIGLLVYFKKRRAKSGDEA